MTDSTSGGDRLELLELPAEERYVEFLSWAMRTRCVWALQGRGGFISLSDDEGHVCFPFWPDAATARASATGDWSDCQPESVSLDALISRWLPGMSKDGRLVAVCPTPDGSSVVIDPAWLLQDLLEDDAESRDGFTP